MSLWGKYLTYAILALAVDIVWGYLGILSLGHGVFFGLGGYAMGMYLMRQIGTRGEYGHPILPDFMVFLNWDKLPWFWHGFDMFPFTVVMILAVPCLLALIFGWLAFKSRVTGVYLSIITQALTYSVMLAFFRNEMGFGGNNGLTDFKDLMGFSLLTDGTKAGLFAATAGTLILAYLTCRFLVSSNLDGPGRHPGCPKTGSASRIYVENVKLWILSFPQVSPDLPAPLCAPGRHNKSV